MPLFFYAILQKLGCRLAPSDEGDSPQCGEMARRDRGDSRSEAGGIFLTNITAIFRHL